MFTPDSRTHSIDSAVLGERPREGDSLFYKPAAKREERGEFYSYIMFPHLDPGLGEVNLHGDLLPCVDVGVVSLLEGALQLLELGRGEGGPDPPLLPLLGQQSALLARVHLVREACTKILDKDSQKPLLFTLFYLRK